MAWLSDWKKRIKLIIDHTKIDEDLFDFPLLVTLVSGIHNNFFDEISYSGRKKIAVTADDYVTQCYVEIEQFDSAAGKVNLWTKIPTVVSGSDTAIYLYCDADKPDNNSYVGDVGSTPAQNVWDDNFVGVWHMNQDPSTGGACIKDSTVSGSHGTVSGTMTSGDLVDGKIGKALDFDGSDDSININGYKGVLGNNDRTVEFIIKKNSISSDTRLITWGTCVSQQKWHVVLNATAVDGTVGAILSECEGGKEIASTDLTDNTFHYGASVFSGTDIDDTIHYVDGMSNARSGGSSNTVNTTSGDDVYFAAGNTSSSGWQYTLCILDEIRISNIARSASWIKATYYSNWDNLISYEPYYQLYKYYFAGYTFEDSTPVSRVVRAYVSSNGRLAGEVTSSGITGYYQLYVATEDNHYLVCMDAEALPDYNNLIVSKATPYSN